MRVLAVSLTERGRSLAGRLPYDRVHGALAESVRRHWADVHGFVLFAATGVAVRVVGPLLTSKETDPAVVCVDEAGRFAVALCGGHGGGANRLATEVADLLGATPVVTTATDAGGTPALDQIPGLTAAGDVARVTTALLDGRRPALDNPACWPVPAWLAERCGDGGGPERIVVTDRRAEAAGPGVVVLHPPSLVVGVGTSTHAPRDEVCELVHAALAGAGLARASVGEVATIDRRAEQPAVTGLGLPVRSYPPDALAAVAVPSPSPVVAAAVGTPSVAEAAALLAAGPDAQLLVTKRASPHATVAVARRPRPRGSVSVVGLGPGAAAWRTPAADAAVRAAEVVIGYGPYVHQAASLLSPGQEVVRSPIGEEVVRAKQAVTEAAGGRRVAMVCSGDAGVYAMASVVLEVAGETGVEVEVVPGVTAGLAAAALLGAPLGHDHLVLSLSDLHTPWPAIAGRLRAAAESDLAVVLYNPRSRRRTWQLEEARHILLSGRPPHTPVGVVTDAGRPGQRVVITTLAGLDTEAVDMTTCVVVGSSTTRIVGGRMVTPRGLLP